MNCGNEWTNITSRCLWPVYTIRVSWQPTQTNYVSPIYSVNPINQINELISQLDSQSDKANKWINTQKLAKRQTSVLQLNQLACQQSALSPTCDLSKGMKCLWFECWHVVSTAWAEISSVYRLSWDMYFLWFEQTCSVCSLSWRETCSVCNLSWRETCSVCHLSRYVYCLRFEQRCAAFIVWAETWDMRDM